MNALELYTNGFLLAAAIAVIAAALIAYRRMRAGKTTDADDIGLFVVIAAAGWPLAVLGAIVFPMLSPDPNAATSSWAARLVDWMTGRS